MKTLFINSPIKWVGGKFKYLPILMPIFEKHINKESTYAEVMLGGGVCMFNILKHLECKHIIIADINIFITKFMEFLMEYPYWIEQPKIKQYINKINIYPLMSESQTQSKFYYKERDKFNTNRDNNYGDMLEVVRMMFLNRATFNGLYRVSKTGKFNASLGLTQKRYVHIPWSFLMELHLLLQDNPKYESFTIHHNKSYLDINYPNPNQTVLYLDAPYIQLKSTYGTTVKSFSSYNKQDFDNLKLANYAQTHKNDFKLLLLNNWDCEEIRDLYQGFHFQEIKTIHTVGPRSSSINSEILISNIKL